MIQEELTKLADEADDEDGEGDAEKDEPVADAPEVKAWPAKYSVGSCSFCAQSSALCALYRLFSSCERASFHAKWFVHAGNLTYKLRCINYWSARQCCN